MVTINGEVQEIIFRNEINGYTVFNITNEGNLTTIIGHIISLSVGETIKVIGKWVYHPSYGQQFLAEKYEKNLPTTQDSIIKFLGSGIIKGVREATSKKIIQKFGDQTFEILNNEPQRLAEIKGISKGKALSIGQAFQEYSKMWNISAFLQRFGISPMFVNRIYKQFGEKVIELIKENPYILADEIPGIGFKTADQIAISMGVDPTSENRIASCITYILTRSAIEQGNTFLPLDKLEKYVSDLLGVAPALVNDIVIFLAVNGKIVIDRSKEQKKVFLRSLNQAEINVAKKLIELSTVQFEDNEKLLTNYISNLDTEQRIRLVKEQKKAVEESIRNGAIVITGGPGTGKTTIINTVVWLLDKLNLSYVLAAPTGRAAKRLSEATGRETKTIHRLLELGIREDEDAGFLSINRDAPVLKEDVVIIDETSMVDIILMNHLLKAIVNGTRLIMVGDVDQLPAVGPGNVLKDIISSGTIRIVRLTDIFRQSDNSMIVENAHKINKGEYPVFNNPEGDFFLCSSLNYEEGLKKIVSLCSKRLPRYKGFDPFKDMQVLSPTRKGLIGVKNLNNELQKVLNPWSKSKPQKIFGDTIFREGDKVMQIRNNYDLGWKRKGTSGEFGFGVFNGDIGVIVEIDEENEIITVLYDDREVEYLSDILDELELAYAVTVHKSQGSEFPVVIMPVLREMPMLTTRNLLYTAITRAKELVVLVGKEDDARFMIDNFREIKRYSGLADKLCEYAVVFN